MNELHRSLLHKPKATKSKGTGRTIGLMSKSKMQNKWTSQTAMSCWDLENARESLGLYNAFTMSATQLNENDQITRTKKKYRTSQARLYYLISQNSS